jgi:RNA polymerase sigma-70 factor (ECF subfamily)
MLQYIHNLKFHISAAREIPSVNEVTTNPATRSDDQHLIELLAQQPAVAAGALYDRYGALVFSVALRIVGDRSAAEEVTQDVFVSCWRNAARYNAGQGSIVTWLLAITHNHAIDELRSRRHKNRRHELTLDQAPQHALTNEHDIDLMLAQSQIREALADLPSNQREVIELLYFGGLSRPEIAQHLSTPLGTIHTRLRLAMNKLRAALLPRYTDDGANTHKQQDAKHKEREV